jgi:Ca2+-transporting ATPase
MAFTALTLTQLVHAFNNKSVRKSLFQIGIANNMSLVFAVLLSLALQILAVQSTTGNLIFKTVHMNLLQWILVTSVALLPFFVVELKKQLRFRILP